MSGPSAPAEPTWSSWWSGCKEKRGSGQGLWAAMAHGQRQMGKADRQTGRLRERDRERLERPGKGWREIEETEMKGQDSQSETEKIKTELDRAGAREIKRAQLDLDVEIEIHLGRGRRRGRKRRERRQTKREGAWKKKRLEPPQTQTT